MRLPVSSPKPTTRSRLYGYSLTAALAMHAYTSPPATPAAKPTFSRPDRCREQLVLAHLRPFPRDQESAVPSTSLTLRSLRSTASAYTHPVPRDPATTVRHEHDARAPLPEQLPGGYTNKAMLSPDQLV